MKKELTFYLLLCFSLNACSNNKADQYQQAKNNYTPAIKEKVLNGNKNPLSLSFKDTIDTKNVNPKKLIAFAETLIGIPYQYGSTNIEEGFDCSGFITYVFNHFQIAVPRSSVAFTNIAKEIKLSNAKPGDLILFTGTDSTKSIVGHMGIITETADTIKFIHSTSGKAYSVTVTPLNKYYQGRFLKTIRIFN
jgi:cell wall-associated NlpC family hydrolase